jgi:hypothetical protein
MTEREFRRELLEDLLVQRATEALDVESEAELKRLLAEFPEVEADAYEFAAAAIWLAACAPAPDAMPASVRERIVASAAAGGLRD